MDLSSPQMYLPRNQVSVKDNPVVVITFSLDENNNIDNNYYYTTLVYLEQYLSCIWMSR